MVLKFILVTDLPCAVNSCDFLDIVFVIDGSESIREADFATTRTLVRDVASSLFTSGDDVAFGLIEYSDEPLIVTNGLETNQAAALAAIDGMQQSAGVTFTGTALQTATTFLERRSRSKVDDRNTVQAGQVMVLITDGVTSFPDQGVLATAIEALGNTEVQVIAVGVGRNGRISTDANELLAIAQNVAENVLTAEFDDFDVLNAILAARVESNCPLTVPCANGPTTHSTTPSTTPTTAPCLFGEPELSKRVLSFLMY